MNKITTMSFQNASDESHIVTVLGMDLAKNVFALHDVNAAGTLRKMLVDDGA